MVWQFNARIEIIGINPYVHLPEDILQHVFVQAGRSRGKIPVRGLINQVPYTQTLVRYSGAWRLYVNTQMLKNSPRRIGEIVELTIEFDPRVRSIVEPEKFIEALNKNKEAKAVYESLSPSRRLEIVRYLARLKSEAALDRNIERAVLFLLGKGRFVGRDRP